MKCRKYSGPDTCVLLLPWNADWKDVAGLVRRNSVQSGFRSVFIYAYSWGAGHGFVALSKALGAEGIPVDYCVLCDPVYRPEWLPTWFNFSPRSLWGKPTIEVPTNVGKVDWFYQTQNKPAGHEPVPLWASTHVNKGVQLVYPHAGMEDSDEFHQKVVHACISAATSPRT